MEPLEDRRLLSVTLTVTNTFNSGLGSLRQAITDANAATAPVTISFNIPATDPGFVDADATLPGGDPGPDVFVIQPLWAFPAINNPNYGITIDGTTQATFGGDTNSFGPEIVLNGSVVGNFSDGLDVYSANNTVEGLVIQQFASMSGVLISGSTASGNVVEGNYIGTNATGTAAVHNRYGVYLSNAPNNTIGGTTAGRETSSREALCITAFTSLGLRLQGTWLKATTSALTPPVRPPWPTNMASTSQLRTTRSAEQPRGRRT